MRSRRTVERRGLQIRRRLGRGLSRTIQICMIAMERVRIRVVFASRARITIGIFGNFVRREGAGILIGERRNRERMRSFSRRWAASVWEIIRRWSTKLYLIKVMFSIFLFLLTVLYILDAPAKFPSHGI